MTFPVLTISCVCSKTLFFGFGMWNVLPMLSRNFVTLWQMEAKMILARLIQTFKLTLPPDYKLVVVQRGTLQPKDDVPCAVELREK